MFGQLLALGTRSSGPARLSDKYVDDLLAPMDRRDQAGLASARTLAYLMHFGGQFGRPFLDKYGDKLYEMDKSQDGLFSFEQVWNLRPRVLEYVPDDPRVTYFDQLAGNPDAAQDFFLHSDRVHYYAGPHKGDNYLEDEGKSLGEALVAATTVYRNAEQTGLRSAQIAADLLNTMGELSHAWPVDNWRADMLPSIATILNSYADDVYYSLSRSQRDQAALFAQDPSLPPGVQRGNEELGTGIYGIGLDPNKIRQVLGQVDHDVKAYGTVINAQLAAASRYLDASLAYIGAHPGEKDDKLIWFGSGYGRVLDALFSTHMLVQPAIAADENQKSDDATSFRLLTLVTVLNAWGTVYPFRAQGGWLRRTTPVAISGASLPWFLHFAGAQGSTDPATAKAVDDLNTWWALTQYGLVDRIQNGGVFAGTPADANTWMTAHGIPPEGRFTDADGKVIPQERMTKDQVDAYLRWHTETGRDGVMRRLARMTDAIESQVDLNPPRIK
jgi:hypothetical protein